MIQHQYGVDDILYLILPLPQLTITDSHVHVPVCFCLCLIRWVSIHLNARVLTLLHCYAVFHKWKLSTARMFSACFQYQVKHHKNVVAFIQHASYNYLAYLVSSKVSWHHRLSTVRHTPSVITTGNLAQEKIYCLTAHESPLWVPNRQVSMS